MPKPFVCDHCKKRKKKSIPHVLHRKATLDLSGWRYTGPFTVHGWPTDHTREIVFVTFLFSATTTLPFQWRKLFLLVAAHAM